WHGGMAAFPVVRPGTALAAWVALDDATESSGCMLMVPGSHRWGDAADIAGTGWSVPGVDDLRAYHGHPVRIVPGPSGAGTSTSITSSSGTAPAPTSRATRGRRSGSTTSARIIATARASGSPTPGSPPARRSTASPPCSSHRAADLAPDQRDVLLEGGARGHGQIARGLEVDG